MWNPNRLGPEDDDLWEVRAFAEDTKNTMSTTWPPRSYACTFCRRDFRSAQALGGHMNVHRHDRAQLRQVPQPRSIGNSMIPSQEPTKGHGLCFLYQLSNPNGGFHSSSPLISGPNSGPRAPPTLLSMSQYQHKNPNFSFSSSTHFPSNHGRFIKAYEPVAGKFSGAYEELDLELRLGQKTNTILSKKTPVKLPVKRR